VNEETDLQIINSHGFGVQYPLMYSYSADHQCMAHIFMPQIGGILCFLAVVYGITYSAHSANPCLTEQIKRRDCGYESDCPMLFMHVVISLVVVTVS
jgi:hypothetical protein